MIRKKVFKSVAALLLLTGGFLFGQTKSEEVLTELLATDAQWSYWYGETDDPKPEGEWFSESFNDSAWNKANGPLGYGAASKVSYSYTPITEDNKAPYSLKGEEGKVPATYYRTTFEIKDIKQVKKVIATIDYDDAAYIYVNGILRAKAGSFKADYLGRDFDPEIAANVTGGVATGAVKVGDPVCNETIAMKASWFKPGKNTIAIVMFQDTGSSSDCVLKFALTASNYIELAKPDRIVANIYEDPCSTIAFTWYSDGNGSDGILQYAESGSAKNASAVNWAKAKSVKATQTGDAEYINRVILTKLKPGTKYFYRFGNDDMWSDAATFKTAPKAKTSDFSFIAVTDQQGSTEEDFAHWTKNFTALSEKYGDKIAFITDTGDFVNDGLSEAEWKLCFNGPAKAMMNTTLVPVTGNHEGYDYANSFANHFTLPSQKDAIVSKGIYYSFDYESVHFTVLNTDEKESEDLSPAQLAWMEEDLKKATANKNIQWKIVLLHRSLYSSGDHATDGDVINLRTSVGDILARYNVDAVLSGHDHVYFRSKQILNGIAQDVKTETIDGITYAVNPRGTVHVVPATISNKNYELATTADYRILQAAEVAGEKYENGRQKWVSYSLLSTSKYYPKGIPANSAVFTKVDVKNNKLIIGSYAITDGKITEVPFDTYAILKDSKKSSMPEVKANKEIAPYTAASSSSNAAAKKSFEYTGEEYDAEKYFKENNGTQGPVWYYYYEENDVLKLLTPMKGRESSAPTDCVYAQHPDAKNTGNDSIQNGAVRLYDGAYDGNPREDGERMILVPFSDDKNEAAKDDIVVAWCAPKDGTIEITDWNPEFVGVVPAEKYLNSYDGFWVDIRLKKGTTGKPEAAKNYRKDSVSILTSKTYAEGDGVVSGGAPKLIDKAGPYDGTYTTGAYVQVKNPVKVKKGDYIYFVSHCGNNYGWRGVMLDCVIKYVK